jgi:hypothetical protein
MELKPAKGAKLAATPLAWDWLQRYDTTSPPE